MTDLRSDEPGPIIQGMNMLPPALALPAEGHLRVLPREASQ